MELKGVCISITQLLPKSFSKCVIIYMQYMTYTHNRWKSSPTVLPARDAAVPFNLEFSYVICMSLSTSEFEHLFTFIGLFISLYIFLRGRRFPVNLKELLWYQGSAAICIADASSRLWCLLTWFMVPAAYEAFNFDVIVNHISLLSSCLDLEGLTHPWVIHTVFQNFANNIFLLSLAVYNGGCRGPILFPNR